MAKNQKFEVAMKKLESIVGELESGSPDLDKMLKLFEEGMKLTAFCREQIKKVEGRISTIMKEGNDLNEKSGIDPS